MQFDIPLSAYARSRWSARLALSVLFIGLAIATRGFLLGVEYRWATALEVRHIPGFEITTRAVLIETPERYRVLRTDDRLLVVQKGGKVCVSKRRLIARRWIRYGLELPGYCRKKPMLMPAPSASVLVVD
ncbi:MAG: hypothetical protein WA790_16100 [Sulfitobacter sp.]